MGAREGTAPGGGKGRDWGGKGTGLAKRRLGFFPYLKVMKEDTSRHSDPLGPLPLSPEQVLAVMLERDRFTRWLGLEIDKIGAGRCQLHYTIREDMLNGFENVHGGILFSAADSAFAFACNSHGRITVALDVSITFTRPAKAGDRMMVEAKEVYLGNKTSVYDIRTINQKGELVAMFKGTAYRTSHFVKK
jgi:acyl-CoA thioesterase